MRVRTMLTTALVAASLVIAPAAAASATTAHHNVLRAWCDNTTSRTWCIDNTDDGILHWRDGHRRIHIVGSDVDEFAKNNRAILRFVHRYSKPCIDEDSPRCYWDAGVGGNGMGDSFIVVGGRHAGQGTVVYLEDHLAR